MNIKLRKINKLGFQQVSDKKIMLLFLAFAKIKAILQRLNQSFIYLQLITIVDSLHQR